MHSFINFDSEWMNESHSSKRNRRPRRDNDVISPPPSVLTQSVLRPVLNPPRRLRPRLRVPADQLHHAAAVRVRLCSRARASAQGRLGGQQQEEEEEERRQGRATREQHHRGPEGAHGQSLVIHQNPFPPTSHDGHQGPEYGISAFSAQKRPLVQLSDNGNEDHVTRENRTGAQRSSQ